MVTGSTQGIGLAFFWGAARDGAAAMPFGRLRTLDDVARLAIFLISDALGPTSGALIDQAQFVFGALD